MTNGIIGAIVFIIGLVVSTIIIYIVTRLFGEKEGIARAFITAIIGAVIYGIAHFLLGNGLLSATIGGIAWLLALRGLYGIGWIKAFIIAVIIWIFSAIVGVLLPTVTWIQNTAKTFLFVMLRTCSNENNVVETPTIKPIIFGFSLLSIKRWKFRQTQCYDNNNGNPTIVWPCAVLTHAWAGKLDEFLLHDPWSEHST